MLVSNDARVHGELLRTLVHLVWGCTGLTHPLLVTEPEPQALIVWYVARRLMKNIILTSHLSSASHYALVASRVRILSTRVSPHSTCPSRILLS